MMLEAVSPKKVQVPTQAFGEPKPDAAGPPAERKKQEDKPDVKLLQQVVEVAQKYLSAREIGLKFSVHQETGRIKVTVLDEETGETIREIPPQGVLDLLAKIEEMIGILFDQKV